MYKHNPEIRQHYFSVKLSVQNKKKTKLLLFISIFSAHISEIHIVFWSLKKQKCLIKSIIELLIVLIAQLLTLFCNVFLFLMFFCDNL